MGPSMVHPLLVLENSGRLCYSEMRIVMAEPQFP